MGINGSKMLAHWSKTKDCNDRYRIEKTVQMCITNFITCIIFQEHDTFLSFSRLVNEEALMEEETPLDIKLMSLMFKNYL